jgi:hypothetical protein
MRDLAKLDVGSPRVELSVLLKLGMLKPEVPSQQVLVGDTLYYQHVYQLSKGILEHKEHGEAGQHIADHVPDGEHLRGWPIEEDPVLLTAVEHYYNDRGDQAHGVAQTAESA